MSGPTPPDDGAVPTPVRHLRQDRGEIARWRHADRLPAVELSLRSAGTFGGYPAQPATVTVHTWPGPVDGITDPNELEAIAQSILAAADWLRRQPAPALEPRQLTIDAEATA